MYSIPKSEIIKLQRLSNGKAKYIVTITKSGDRYKLYKIIDGTAINTNRSSENPLNLEKYMV